MPEPRTWQSVVESLRRNK